MEVSLLFQTKKCFFLANFFQGICKFCNILHTQNFQFSVQPVFIGMWKFDRWKELDKNVLNSTFDNCVNASYDKLTGCWQWKDKIFIYPMFLHCIEPYFMRVLWSFKKKYFSLIVFTTLLLLPKMWQMYKVF